MTVAELFKKLSYGELANLAMSTEAGPEEYIAAAKHPQIILHANEGLLRLYSRFLLGEKSVFIETLENVTSYRLEKRFAESNTASTETHKFIKDILQEDPFESDVLKILEVYDEYGCKKPLNDMENSYSLFTPQPYILQVPAPIQGEAMSVSYQARHLELVDSGDGYLDQQISLPFFLEGALTAFIGYKVYSHMNGQENMAKSQEFMVTFDQICTDAEDRDLVNQTFHTTHCKLESRGFV